jgi:hypothetical protein
MSQFWLILDSFQAEAHQGSQANQGQNVKQGNSERQVFLLQLTLHVTNAL